MMGSESIGHGIGHLDKSPELRAAEAERWAAEKTAELNADLAAKIEKDINAPIKEIVRLVILASLAFLFAAAAWYCWP